MDKGRKLHTVPNEEDWRVITHHVPVTFFGVELDREASMVTGRVRRTFLSSNCGQTGGNLRLLSNFTKQVCGTLFQS